MISDKEDKMKHHIKRLKRELVYQGSILDIYADYMQLPDGKTTKWDFVSHRKGAAAVVAVAENGNLLLVRQYRSALDRETLEIPAGSRDSVTEDTMVCATRELEEETGWKSEHVEKLLQLKTTVAFCNEFIDVYLATDLTLGVQKLDEGEEIEIVSMPLDEAVQKIYCGEIQDAKTVAGILAYQSKLLTGRIHK